MEKTEVLRSWRVLLTSWHKAERGNTERILRSHWNPDGSLLSDSQVKEFAENTIVLCEVLACNICGNLPNRDKSGSY